MSDPDADDLTLQVHRRRQILPNGVFDANTAYTPRSSPTNKPQTLFKARDIISPVSNRGTEELSHSFKTSFAPPSTSNTRSTDELTEAFVDSFLRQGSMRHDQTLNTTKSTSALASASYLGLHDSRSPTPPVRYPRSSLISPRRAQATGSTDRVVPSLRHRPNQGEFYRPDYDELETWTDASVSPVVFGKFVFMDDPPEDTLHAAIKHNLKPLARSIEERSGIETEVNTALRSARPPLVAVSEMSRAARCELILNDIFTPDPSVDERDDDVISSRASPSIADPDAAAFERPLRTLFHKRTFSRTLLSLGNSSVYRPQNRPPLQDLPISSPVHSPSRPNPDVHEHLVSPPFVHPSQVNEGLKFTIDRHSALYQQPKLFVVEEDNLLPDSLPVISSSITNSVPSNSRPSLDISQDSIPNPEIVLVTSAKQGVLLPIQSNNSTSSQFSGHDTNNPIIRSPGEGVIEIYSPMVMKEHYASVIGQLDPNPNSTSVASTSGKNHIEEILAPPTHIAADAIVCSEAAILDERVNEAYVPETAPPNQTLGNLLHVSTDEPPPSFPSPTPTPPRGKLRESPMTMKFAIPANATAQPKWVRIDSIPLDKTLDSGKSSMIPRAVPVPTVLNSEYLKPRLRNLWAPEDDNPYLQSAKGHMLVGKIRTDLETRYEGELDDELDEIDDEDGEEEEERDELEPEDIESEDECVEMQHDNGVVFLSQRPEPVTSSPFENARASSSAETPRLLVYNNHYRSKEESASAKKSNKPRFNPYDTAHRKGRRKEKLGPQLLDESSKMRENLGDRLVLWESLLASFIGGKETSEQQVFPDLEQALQDIRSSAVYISPASMLVGQLRALANMEPQEMGGREGLRALAKELMQTWA